MKSNFVKRMVLIISAVVIGVLLAIVMALYVRRNIWQEVADISKYEEILGENGKYKDNLVGYNDIFPDSLEKSDQVEAFRYIYCNPWDANYFGYLVCSYSEAGYEEEVARLRGLKKTEYKGIYGIDSFPLELCAVYADDTYGVIYSLADNKEKKIIYVALEFCNYFTDIHYEKKLDVQYLPKDFNAKPGNETRKAFEERTRVLQ